LAAAVTACCHAILLAPSIVLVAPFSIR